ncbi:MAG: winged helix-turn-helix domain-containing protein [Bryobacteraceae bacterium]|nr:winged helix-turn-helix domain-containing protein [Bryobacteraceae bacterium]
MSGYRFGPFELESGSRQLRKHGLAIRLAGKPVELLLALLERPGEIVSREELRSRLWPDTNVDYERGLNNAVNRVRAALSDAAAAPRFIETISGRGYRLIIPVEKIQTESAVPAAARPAPWNRWPGAAAAGIFLALSLWILPAPEAGPDPPPASHAAGIYHHEQWRAESLVQARRHFEEAIAAAPEFAESRAYLAIVVLDMAEIGLLPAREAGQIAQQQAGKALELAPRSAVVQSAVAGVETKVRWRLRQAMGSAEKAVRLDRRSPLAWRTLASVRMARGEIQGAVRAMNQAIRISPATPLNRLWAGHLQYLARNFQESVRELELALTMDPGLAPAHRLLSDSYLRVGRSEDARIQFETWLAQVRVGEEEIARVRAIIQTAGFTGLWRRNLGNPNRKPEGSPGAAMKLAAMYAAIGEAEPAMDWLERAAAEREPQLLFVAVDPRFDAVRGSPRYREWMRALGSS